MDYFISWVALLVVSLIAGLTAFFWSIRTGQFSDQNRARYLPLSEALPPRPKENPFQRTIELGALLLILLLGLAAVVASLLVGLRLF